MKQKLPAQNQQLPANQPVHPQKHDHLDLPVRHSFYQICSLSIRSRLAQMSRSRKESRKLPVKHKI